MKVDNNAPAFPFPASADHHVCTGIPLRLEIAARFMAASLSAIEYRIDNAIRDAESFLKAADTLIDAHNATCGK